MRNTWVKMMDAFVDSVFEIVDQPLLPSQVLDILTLILTLCNDLKQSIYKMFSIHMLATYKILLIIYII